MARSSRVRTTAALVLANLLLPVAVLVFAFGFFPYKPVLPGLATFEHEDAVAGGTEQEASEGNAAVAAGGGRGGEGGAVFDRVVFMVVDALRSDFVYGHESGFQFTQSLIRAGAAVPFTAHATPPTVTMPRVKALTTGSVPSFLDLILNFAESDTSSSLAAQDTWLAQIRAMTTTTTRDEDEDEDGKNKKRQRQRKNKIVFYGDDTWLKLFPDPAFFARVDGTSSFFVSDFTEVDNNVTRHVPEEMAQEDWGAMIMHYLGLDHIGHKTGPQGPQMLPKQREMDGIVQQIYQAMEREEHHAHTLLVLAGDHGMNGGGNHGGSGPGETEPALLFASPKFVEMPKRRTYESPALPKEGTEFHYYTKVEQSDLVPSLASLMGMPIPRNSLGLIIPELGGFWSEAEAVRQLRRNALQIGEIVQATYGAEAWQMRLQEARRQLIATVEACEDRPEGEQRLACLWAYAEELAQESNASARNWSEQQMAITAFLRSAQDTLSGTASSYNIPWMVAGMVLSAGIVVLALVSFPSLWPFSAASASFAATTLLYGGMMFASSYVEEEQQFWYWVTPAWIVVLAAQRRSPDLRTCLRTALAAAALLAVHRLCVRWNQTGQKHAGAPDIVHAFFPDAHLLMWILILAAYAHTGLLLARRAFAGLMNPELAVCLAVLLVVPAMVFKLMFTLADAPELVPGLAREWIAAAPPSFFDDLVLQARVVFAALALATALVATLSVLSARESRRTGSRDAGLLPSLSQRLHHLLTLFLMTQTRAPNVPLFLGWETQRQALAYLLDTAALSQPQKLRSSVVVMPIATTVLLLSHVSFFATGGSNSISSIDLSNAYNGVADYNIVAVGVLLFASNWTGPIWWCSAANLLLSPPALSRNSSAAPAAPPQRGNTKHQPQHQQRSWVDDERQKLHQDTLRAITRPGNQTASSDGLDAAAAAAWTVYLSSMTAFVAMSLLAVMAACTALRTHLFIWTVFSPKYLYAMAWAVGWHLLINLGLGSLLRRLVAVA